MQLLSLKNFSVSVKGHFLFYIDQLNIESGDKIGLIGANASGKSTFLNTILKTDLSYSAGNFMRKGRWSYFKQKSKDIPIVDSWEQIGRWGLEDFYYREDRNFSGGEEARLRLAKVFAEPHDMLLLDEPTAHLDQEAITELKHQLSQEDTFILVSHDRNFLNEFCHRLLVIQDKKLLDYPGNYDAWKAQNELDRQSKIHAYEKAKQEERRLLSVMEEQKRRAARTQRKPRNISSSDAKSKAFGAVGKSIGGKEKSLSAAAKNTKKRLERLGEIKKPTSPTKIRPDFRITDPPQNKIIVEIDNLSFSYPNSHLLFDQLTLHLERNKRVALVGENGVGKSTLLRLIRDGHPSIRTVPKAKFGYFDQAFKDIDFNRTILENIHLTSIQAENINRNVLFRMDFPAEVLGEKAGVLSGGELTKLSFAKLFVSDCNVLLIDEPSNYLDIPSYEAIEALLLDFEGSMLFTSHDVYLVETVAEEIFELKNQKLVRLK
ncbi:MAG TPA: ATP-binding cassette domain-containing protein [Atopostipes sp.]|nr:ATP-binding cassette domain-containing protein [Atopostipes sp.]